MHPVLHELLDLLRLERLERDLFRGRSQDLGWGAVFGGQVVGQALSAARQTVPPERSVHSLHGYFLLPGDVTKPIVYDVDRIRDGNSFTTRRVVAIQDGQAIFNMSASFQKQETSFEHQVVKPDAPGPEGLASQLELARRVEDRIPARLRPLALAERPIEIRPIDPIDPLVPDVRPGKRMSWYRTIDRLPDGPSIHQDLLAYASDFYFLATALQPHGRSWLDPRIQIASLDHAMWFHRPFRFDEWLLYVVESPTASGARGLVLGKFYTPAGELVASCAQEGLLRQRG